MGAWGEGPFQNDSAADLLIGLMKSIELVVTRKSDRSAAYHYQEARCCAAILLVAFGTDILGGPSPIVVLGALERQRDDAEYVASWRDPDAFLRLINSEIALWRRRAISFPGDALTKARELIEARKNRSAPVARRMRKRIKRRRKGVKVPAGLLTIPGSKPYAVR